MLPNPTLSSYVPSNQTTLRLGSLHPCMTAFPCHNYSRYPILWAFDHVQMGLGKTLQAISLLSYLKIQRIAPGPFRKYPTSDFFSFFFFYIGFHRATTCILIP